MAGLPTAANDSQAPVASFFESTGVPCGAAFTSLAAQDASLDELSAFVDAVCEEHAAPFRVRFDVQLALEELFVNVVRHGFEDGRPRTDVWLAAWAEPAGDPSSVWELRFSMSDAGVPYDPLRYRWQKVEGSRGEANKVGGLGILLVRERMDDVSYRHFDGRNVVSLTKRLRAASE